MRTTVHQWSLLCFLLFSRSRVFFVSAYEATSRWGQATVVVNGALFVYGGKTDEFNQFSYTSAPNINDILLLPLSSPFNVSSPPWELVSSSTNQSTSQGPALAWSTLSALNNTNVLLFGGEEDVDSVTNSAEAELLDVYSRIQPEWLNSTQFADQPPPRLRHSSATASSGVVFIFGGEKADGSGIALSDHFSFDPGSLSFSFLPTNNGPPDIFGHTSIILSDGRILVFGGYSPSQGILLPFSSIWILDTTTLSWNLSTTSASSFPSPRVAFAAVLISDGKILIHGGSDSSFQNNFDDGWVLDTTQNPMTWTAVDALSQLGALRDHFAVSSSDVVIFGFGYGANGPAPATLQIFNTTSGSFPSEFIPPAVSAIPTTLPYPTQTQTSHTGSYTSSPYSSTVGIHPTSTHNPHVPTSTSDADTSSVSTTAVAVGTSLGVLALIVVALGAAYYVRKRHRDRDDGRFIALGADDNDDGRDSPHFEGAIPVASTTESGELRGHSRILNTLGIAGALAVASKIRTARSAVTVRRDILADEDTRSLGEWYNARRRDGRGNSSWSLLSILGGARRSRNASTTSHGTGGLPTSWREKGDPFSDGAAVVRDEETGFIGAAAVGAFGSRPHSRREMSHASYASSRSAASYRDPFLDPVHEAGQPEFQPLDLYTDHPPATEADTTAQPTVRYVPPLAPLRTAAPPLSQQIGHPLSPLSEHTSQSTLPHNFSSSASSNAHSSDDVTPIFSPITGGSTSRATSRTSLGMLAAPGSPRSSSSIIGASSDHALLAPTQPMRRSDSWWSRFSRTSLLDRRSHDSTARAAYDIRDPTPAPKLGAIAEGSLRTSPSQHSPQASSPDSAEPDKQLQAGAGATSASQTPYVAAAHGKSMSSVHTADTAAIERMAGTMDVAQRRWGSGSSSSRGALSIDTRASISGSEAGDDGSLRGSVIEGQRGQEDLMLFASPVAEATPRALGPIRLPSPAPAQKALRFAPVGPPPPAPSGKVSERIQAYERRMSESQPTSPPPTNSKHREERTKKRVEVDYGLVPRPSLFVANPDHRLSTRSVSS